MLATVLIVSIILFFPLFLSINGFISKDLKKIYFSICLFGFIKILSGYAQFLSDGVAFHLTRKKAYIYFYKKIFDLKNSVKPLKDYHIIKFYSVLEIGSLNGLFLPLSAGIALNYVNNIILWLFDNKKPYVKINNYIDIYENKDIFNLYLKASLVLNLLMIILSIIKICVEKIVNGIRKRKQNKFCN